MAETSASKLAKRIHTDGSTHYKGTTEPAGAVEGDLFYNTSSNGLFAHNGTSFVKVDAKIPTLTSVSGSIIATAATDLTLAGTNFLTSSLVVNFLQSGDSINENVTVTPSSQTAATVAVPAAVYNNVTSGNAVTIKVTNSDGLSSGTVNTTAVAYPTGGTVTTSGNYRIHTFTSSGSFVNGISGLDVEYLIVAGGASGGGSSSGSSCGGGGGAGGMLTGSMSNVSVATHSVTVGAGGSGNTSFRGTNGGDSTFNSVTSTGGGGGGKNNHNSQSQGISGGSGGGGGAVYGGTVWSPGPTGGSGTAGQGNDGGTGYNSSDVAGQRGGGGGGKGAVGQDAPSINSGGNGGTGTASSITGSSVTYAGGGGGGTWTSGGNSSGGSGGGGAGSVNNGTAGTANTGGGGGGSGGGSPSSGRDGANGGSGIVVIRYDTTNLT